VPEGDTIFRAARTMNQVFAGQVVTRFESVFPALTRFHDDHPVVGRTVEGVSARGKHLLVSFSGDAILRTHMRMNGSWHVYPVDAPWRRPARDLRILFAVADAVAIAFNVHVAEFLTASQLARDSPVARLGPDLLDPAFDPVEASRRIRERSDQPVAEVLLDQRVISGIGNEFKSEVLFVAGINPFATVSSLDSSAIDRLIDVALDQLRANVLSRRQALSPAYGRRTYRSLNPSEKSWVYGRGGRPCRRCGAPIQSRAAGPDARLTYWCARCQRRPTLPVTSE
jgi:endonuclease VIII